MISIIVPVFNSENYIKQCIESILGQSLREIELILVDDGSTDNSGNICEEYARMDDRVKVLRQKNKGRVLARKAGLQNASFDYVMFCDSDDWVEEEMCEKILELALTHQTELVTCGYIKDEGGVCQVETDTYPEGLYYTKEDLKELQLNSFVYHDRDCLGMIPTVWTKLYCRKLAIEAFAHVPENLYRGEDLLFNNLYLMNCKSVYVSKAAYYHYRIHKASTVHQPVPDFISQIGMVHSMLKQESLKLPYREEYLKDVNIRTFLNFLRLWNENQSEIHMPYYCFRMGDVGTGKMVLYGAGKVGRDYYELLHKLMPGKVVLWVDKAWQNYNGKYEVCPVKEIKAVNFEQILIAVESEETAKEIKCSLAEEYGISDSKMLWQKPERFWF